MSHAYGLTAGSVRTRYQQVNDPALNSPPTVWFPAIPAPSRGQKSHVELTEQNAQWLEVDHPVTTLGDRTQELLRHMVRIGRLLRHRERHLLPQRCLHRTRAYH